MKKSFLLLVSFAAAASMAKADLVPYLCQQPGSACGGTAAFTTSGANSYVYNYSIDLSAAEQLNSTLGSSTVTLSGLTGVTGAIAPTGWTLDSFTATSANFSPTAAENGAGKKDFGIFAIDTTVGGSMADTGSYSSQAWKLNNLQDVATGQLIVNAPAAAIPEPSTLLLMGFGLAGASLLGRAKRAN